jgi:hypothetical protein
MIGLLAHAARGAGAALEHLGWTVAVSSVAMTVWAGPAVSQQVPSARDTPAASKKVATPAASSGYYVEFRAARIGTYGHSYVVYGRLNARGEPADFHYTDRHPVGNYGLMALGHVLPVPANTTWNPEVLQLPVSSSYRHRLTAGQYHNLVRAVRLAQAEKAPTWNAIANNCNHYAAMLARAAGLKAPENLQLSYDFVPTMRDLNTHNSSNAARPGRSATPVHPSSTAPRI